MTEKVDVNFGLAFVQLINVVSINFKLYLSYITNMNLIIFLLRL